MDWVSEIVIPNVHSPLFLYNEPQIFSLELGYPEFKTIPDSLAARCDYVTK